MTDALSNGAAYLANTTLSAAYMLGTLSTTALVLAFADSSSPFLQRQSSASDSLLQSQGSLLQRLSGSTSPLSSQAMLASNHSTLVTSDPLDSALNLSGSLTLALRRLALFQAQSPLARRSLDSANSTTITVQPSSQTNATTSSPVVASAVTASTPGYSNSRTSSPVVASSNSRSSHSPSSSALTLRG